MFKQIFYENKPTHYLIFDDGIVYNMKTHKNLYGSQTNGYIKIQLMIDDKPKDFFLHRLLAEYFIDNPNNKTIVHHIDGNPLNNSLNNLTWVTQEENSNLKCCISPKVENTIPIFTQEELDNEIWKPLKNSHYSVSSLGRKRNEKTKKITIGSQNKNSGYIRWALGDYGEIQAHRAVYLAFHPDEEIKVINHIDGNRANNRLSNLENITQSKNIEKSFYETRSKKTYFVAQYDLQDNLINIYPSMAECARAIEVANTSVVRNSILQNYTCKGFKLVFSNLEEYKKFKHLN